MTTYYAQASGDIASIAFNTAPNGSGSSWSYAASTSSVIDLNTYIVQPFASLTTVTAGTIQNTGGGTLACSNSGTIASALYSTYAGTMVTIAPAKALTVNGNLLYSGTYATGGMVQLNQSGSSMAVNGQVTNTSTGFCIYGSSQPITLAISNSGGVAVSCSNGYGVFGPFSIGTLAVTGLVTISGGNYAVDFSGQYTLTQGSSTYALSSTGSSGIALASSGNGTIVGSIYASGSYAIRNTGGTIVINGSMSTSGNGQIFYSGASGTMQWIGAQILASGASCNLGLINSGTLALATSSGALNLHNSGSLSLIYQLPGTITTTSGTNVASITNTAATAQAAILNNTAAQSIVNSYSSGSGSAGLALIGAEGCAGMALIGVGDFDV